MKHSYRQPWLALALVIVAAAVVVACGQVTTGEDAQSPEGLRAAQAATGRLTQDHVCDDGASGCGPTGAHAAHGSQACTVCHKYAGTLSFDKNGPAYAAGKPAPKFDATTKTCSNIACHGVPAGVYEYYNYDGILVQAPYGGTAGSTPSWYATGAGCLACHDLKYQGVAYEWHSGNHGKPMYQANLCQTCHLDATGGIDALGNPFGLVLSTATNCPPLAPTNTTECAKYHANGTLNVTPVYRSGCFNCH